MKIAIFENSQAMGVSAGKVAAELIRTSLKNKGEANIILATGTSQFEVLNQLLNETDIDWSQVTMFHLDEYIGLPDTHPASFRKYLKERFIEKVTLKSYHLINAETNPEGECERLGKLILAHPIDVALVGIGENGHLAFNDPPADFDTEAPYIIVNLDEPCRRQQLGEGWFPSLEAVPTQAISMSIRQIMKSAHIICSVPDERKAQAVKNCLEGTVSPLFPASILQQHPACSVFLDVFSSKHLEKNY
jgi:glucosamine-6-phosphate deaminase